MEENSSENLQNKKYFRNIDEAIKVYEKFRRFKDKGFIKSIDPDFFFNLTDMFLSDYKRVLEINEVLLKENEEVKIRNNAIKRESEAYAEHIIRLDNELNLGKEKSKYEWIRQNCLSQELVNKLYIPIQKVKDKISERQFELQQEYKDFEDDAILTVLQELIEMKY